MKKQKIPVLLSIVLAALFISGCGRSERKELHVYNWSDYMDPEVIAIFEEQFDCRVILDIFDSNEAMYAKLKAGATGYDVIFPSSYQAAMMYQEGMLLELNLDNLPNVVNVDADFMQRFSIDADMKYSIPYMSGTTGIAYRESIFGEDFEASWRVYGDAEFRGRMTLLDDMRETLGAALKLLGFSLNSINPAEVEAAGEVVKQWKANIAKFENEGYKSGIASGEFHLVHGYSGDIMQVMDEDEEGDIVYALPAEGFTIWIDDMAIPATADNIALAEAFINFMHDPEIAAMNMNFNYYVAPNAPAYELIDEEIREDETIFLSAESKANAETIKPLGEHIGIYSRVWDGVKSAR